MKEKLIAILGLPADADEATIIKTVEGMAAENKRRETSGSFERKIAKKISDSGGALNREQAIMALEHQEEADAKRQKKAKG